VVREGRAKGDPDAMIYLGRLYENGWGVARDFAKAREWYQKAADTGYELAKSYLKRLPTAARL
jgi:TPR repeat protein